MRPREVRRRPIEKQLDIRWDDGRKSTFAYAFLREQCRCSRCRANAQQGIVIDTPEDLTIIEIAEFGGYALRFHFSDGHNTGIYPWEYLADLDAEPGAKT